MYQNRSPLANIPPVTKNLIIINAIMLFATTMLERSGINLTRYLALYYPQSEYFLPTQFITHLFMHGGFRHLLFNMFALWMFGRILESEHVWGSKKFLIYYLLTGIGAAALHTFVNYMEIAPMAKAVTEFSNTPTPELFNAFVSKYHDFFNPEYISHLRDTSMQWADNLGQAKYENWAITQLNSLLNARINIPTVGASGAVYGVLLAFGMLFPNTRIMLYFAIPIKAKYLVMGFVVLELFLGILNPEVTLRTLHTWEE